MKREIRVCLSFSYAKYQGLCSCGAIFLRAPTVSELPSALLEMRTLFLGFASKATLALLLMVHQEKREMRVHLPLFLVDHQGLEPWTDRL